VNALSITTVHVHHLGLTFTVCLFTMFRDPADDIAQDIWAAIAKQRD
jgi:hypothetical protein